MLPAKLCATTIAKVLFEKVNFWHLIFHTLDRTTTTDMQRYRSRQQTTAPLCMLDIRGWGEPVSCPPSHRVAVVCETCNHRHLHSSHPSYYPSPVTTIPSPFRFHRAVRLLHNSGGSGRQAVCVYRHGSLVQHHHHHEHHHQKSWSWTDDDERWAKQQMISQYVFYTLNS